MESLFEILFRASLSIALLYSLYWLLLRQSTHFKANRYFLLISLLISVGIAIVPIQYQILIPAPSSPVLSEYNGVFNHDITNTTTDSQKSNGIGIFSVLLLVYSIGAVFILLRIFIQCRKPLLIISKSKPKKINDCLIHENKVYNSPFSFFNRILINPEYFQQNEISDILTHEKVHIHERHWIDLFIIELLTVFFWFNPFIWLFERAIKQNHEYLADEGVLSRSHSPVRYQALLINQLMGTQVIGLANHFSSAQGPTRFKMMTKEKTAKRKLFRMIWGIPVLAILLVAFAKPEYKIQRQENAKTNTIIVPDGKEYKMQSQKNVKTNTIVAPDGEGYNVLLMDGTRVFLQANSKLVYPEKFADEARIVTIDGEAYFEVSESKTPFIVKNVKGKIINTIAPDQKKVAISTITGHAIIPSQAEKSNYVEYEDNTTKLINQILSKVNLLKGKVTDEQGNPLTGASIVIQGTNIGAVVDISGNFEINYSPKEKEFNLVASFVGFTTASTQIKVDKAKSNVLEYKLILKKAVIKLDSKSIFLDRIAPPPPPVEFSKSNEPVFIVVEDMPHYPGDRYGLGQYVKKKTSALKNKFGNKLSGKATVGFTINAKGEVTNIQVLEQSNDVAAKAVTLIVSGMEKWKPGSQRGKNVPVDFAMELEF